MSALIVLLLVAIVVILLGFAFSGFLKSNGRWLAWVIVIVLILIAMNQGL
jgi:hypothetical protein